MQLCRTQSQSGEVCETRRTTTQLEMQQEQKKLQQQQQELVAGAGSRSWEQELGAGRRGQQAGTNR